MDAENVARSAEGVGYSVEEATRNALEALGVRRDQAYVEVVERPRRTFLGFRSGEVRVRALVLPGAAEPGSPGRGPAGPAAPYRPSTPGGPGGQRRDPGPRRPREQRPERPRDQRPDRAERDSGDQNHPPTRRPRSAGGASDRRRTGSFRTPAIEANYVPVDADTPEAEEALGILTQLVELLGLDVPVRLAEDGPKPPRHSGPVVALEIEGEDLGLLIGRRGSTLESLEYLLRVMVNQKTGTWPYLTIDVNGYRRRRVETLRSLAQRMAALAEQESREVVLEPMSPPERRVIHLALQDHPGVLTRSVGYGETRKITIRPKE